MMKCRPRTDGEVTTVKNTICLMLQDPEHFLKGSLGFSCMLDLYSSFNKRAKTAERILNKVFNEDGTFKLDANGNVACGHKEIQMELDNLKRYQKPFIITEEDEKEIREFRREMRRNQKTSEGGD